MSKYKIELGAHRGLGCTDNDVYQSVRDIAALPVENTLQSIEAAFEQYDVGYVELDVVMSGDGQLFLMHNVLPADHFFGNGPVYPLNTVNFEEFAHDGTGRFQRGKIARFSEALELIARLDPQRLPWAVNIEVKGVQASRQPYEENDFLEQIVLEIKNSSLPMERVLFSSFALMNVLRIANLAPQAHFAMLFCEDGELKKTYTNHLDDMRYMYQEFRASTVDETLRTWVSESAVPDKPLYMHPEIMSVNEKMLDKMAAMDLSVNIWPNKEVLTTERAEWYKRVTAYAVTKKIPLTVMTDYLPEMLGLKL